MAFFELPQRDRRIAASHRLAVRSRLAVTICLPSGEKRAERTASVVAGEHRGVQHADFLVALRRSRGGRCSSWPPERTYLPSGEKTHGGLRCRGREATSTASPVATSHRRIALSSPPLSDSWPLGEKATQRTGPSCPAGAGSSASLRLRRRASLAISTGLHFVRVPDHHELVVAAGGDQLAVGREAGRVDGAVVAGEFGELGIVELGWALGGCGWTLLLLARSLLFARRSPCRPGRR